MLWGDSVVSGWLLILWFDEVGCIHRRDERVLRAEAREPHRYVGAIHTFGWGP